MLSSPRESAKRLSSPGKKQVAEALNDSGRAPVPIARPEIHETVAGILDPFPRGKLLDVPAGEGALSGRLSEAGFNVQACDLYPEIFMLRNIDVRRGIYSATFPMGIARFQKLLS